MSPRVVFLFVLLLTSCDKTNLAEQILLGSDGAVSDSATEPEDAPSGTFSRPCVPPEVGAEAIMETSSASSFEFDVDGKSNLVKHQEEALVREVVLGTDTEGITRMRLTVLRHTTSSDRRTPSIAGTSLTLTQRGVEPPSKQSEAFIRTMVGSLRFMPITKYVPSRPLAPGNDVPELAKGIRELVEASLDGVVVQALRASYAGRDNGTDRFELSLRTTLQKSRMTLDYTIEGHLLVRVEDCRPLEFALEGVARQSGTHPTMSVRSGSISMRRRYEYPALHKDAEPPGEMAP